MRLHRFIINFNLKTGDLRIKNSELYNQFRNVLELKRGEKIILGDGKGKEGIAEFKNYGKDFIEIKISEISVNQNEPQRRVVLYCAVLKKENFEWVAQKATEVGIAEIAPLITSRTIKLDIRKERLEKIIKESAEQSGRGVVPILRDPINFKAAISGVNKYGINFFSDQSGVSFENCKLKIENLPLRVWVGPEGGWTPDELKSAKKAGFEIISFGKLTLRAETAAIIGSYLAINTRE